MKKKLKGYAIKKIKGGTLSKKNNMVGYFKKNNRGGNKKYPQK